MKDLRSHHFDFGHDPNDFKAEYAAKYTEKDFDPSNQDGIMNPYKNSYKIGDGSKGQPDHYTSLYKEEMTEKELLPREKPTRHSDMDYVPTVQLFDPNAGFEGISEFTDKY